MQCSVQLRGCVWATRCVVCLIGHMTLSKALDVRSGGLAKAPMAPGAQALEESQQASSALAATRATAAAMAPFLSNSNCVAAAARIGAMKCSLILSDPPGFEAAEGCECQLESDKCPPADATLGFTGVSPSTPVSLPQMDGLTVILCMYWQWLDKPDRSSEKVVDASAVKVMADQLVQQGHQLANLYTAQVMGPLGPSPSPGPGPSPGPAPGFAPAPSAFLVR
eukprot:TRINITY_DN62441_c0_g1_i1.p1 TRINITY_DN62441_c0_g1~~TRINITY_DN62441_c0_g1_i1.p1  ORF type:complete len:223 (-),score=27.90 TRINITY_DN62441_c0_g1_i1:71-739(-)